MPDAIAQAVLREIERRRGGDDEVTVQGLARDLGLHRPELAYWLGGSRSLRSDKAALVLKALGLVVVRKGLVRKR